MTKGYSILQKKLQELESQLNTIFSSPEDDHDSADFMQRMGFARSLLSAEMALHPTKPHHLLHVSRRLDELDAAFFDWAGFGNSSQIQHHIDGASTCSCTESCLNDDGEVISEEVQLPEDPPVIYRDPPEMVLDDVGVHSEEGFGEDDRFGMVEHGYEGVDDETASFGDVEFLDCLVGEKREDIGVDDNVVESTERVVYGEKVESWFSRAVAGGMVLGMALMGFVMTVFSGCFEENDQLGNFLTPT